MTKPISQRAYARHRNCSPTAVRKAIIEGRLKDSVKANAKGAMQILDITAADEEWARNTGPRSESREVDTAAERSKPDGEVTLTEAKRRKAIEDLKVARINAEHQEMDIAERRGDLLSAKQVRADVEEAYTHVRTKLLGVSTRCKQRIPGLCSADIKVIDGLIREALEELAEGL